MSEHITKLENAKAMRRMCMPLNTPVIERTFSKQYSRLWVRYMKACMAFARATLDHSKKCNRKSWKRCDAAFHELIEINNICVQSSENPKWDEGERGILLALHEQKLWPFLEEVAPAFEPGEPITLPPIKTWSIWWSDALESAQ
jgi:hypothetical protein